MSDEHQREPELVHESVTIDNILPPDDGPAVGGKGAKRATDPTFKRNMIILGSVVLVMMLSAVGVVMALMSKAKPKNGGSEVHMSTATLPSTPDDRTPISPVMRELAASEAAAEFQHQKEQGQHVILPQEPDNKVQSTVSQGPANRPYTNDVPLTQEQLAAQRMQEQAAADAAQQRQQMQQSRMEGVQRQLEGLISSRELGNPITTVSWNTTKGSPDGSTGTSATSPAAASGAASGSASTTPAIAGALELFIGETMNAIDTYRTDWCSSQIVAGKLKGAYLKGKCLQKDEGLSMHFTEMRFNGQAYAIDATGIDEKTSSDAMSNIDIDRRIFQRYVFPVTVAAISGAATVLGQPATNTTSTGGVVTSSTAAASKGQAIAAGVGAGVGVLQSMAQTAAAKPVQITMEDKSPIGIMFNKPVRDPL